MASMKNKKTVLFGFVLAFCQLYGGGLVEEASKKLPLPVGAVGAIGTAEVVLPRGSETTLRGSVMS